MTSAEYEKFVELVERHGGAVYTYAKFPTPAQRDAARDEARLTEALERAAPPCSQ